jgi:AcrR family transcriptional regulator
MARWEPNARERLERAALELFASRGYDATTVTEIADRAGLTKSTFFRHFTDKRDVLSGGQELLVQLFQETIAAAPPAATIGDCLASALDAAGCVFTPERHDLSLKRRAVIAANSELQERELLKRARLSSVIAGALRARGADETTAMLAAQIGVLAFSTAYARWAEPENQRPYAEIALAVLRDLQASAAALGEAAALSNLPRARGPEGPARYEPLGRWGSRCLGPVVAA